MVLALFTSTWSTKSGRVRVLVVATDLSVSRRMAEAMAGVGAWLHFRPSDQAQDTLKRNSTTSPSRITYSLPSTRALPAARTAASEPASTRSS